MTRPIKIAINALGGQGGGVLAAWIVDAAERAGFLAQSTSVPGVAQRTGATLYYIELFPEAAAREKGKAPVLALSPFPGDVDIVLAAEIMEAGRAIARGLVTRDTTLIASAHRVYAIAEKIAPGDGRQSAEGIIAVARACAKRVILMDMERAAAAANAPISAVLLGALAGACVLPIERRSFEDAIRASGRATERNLAAFAQGFDGAPNAVIETKAATATPAEAPAPAVAPLVARLEAFPPPVRPTLREGLKRAVDFQDLRYGEEYLDRLQAILAADSDRDAWRLTAAVGKHLALWMTYEDAIRVADLKTRRSRFARFREDVRAAPGQIVHVSEYLHPRVEEICDILPSGLGRAILNSRWLRRIVAALLGGGRRVSTTKLRGFLPLAFMASLRPFRRATHRFAIEQARIKEWLTLILETAPADYALAFEIAGLQRLMKGYGETHERGLANFRRIIDLIPATRVDPRPAAMIARLRDAALKDEEGRALAAAIAALPSGARAA